MRARDFVGRRRWVGDKRPITLLRKDSTAAAAGTPTAVGLPMKIERAWARSGVLLVGAALLGVPNIEGGARGPLVFMVSSGRSIVRESKNSAIGSTATARLRCNQEPQSTTTPTAPRAIAQERSHRSLFGVCNPGTLYGSTIRLSGLP